MGKLGYNLANACFGDIAEDPAFFMQLREKAQFPFISTNVVKSTTSEPYFAPYRIINIGGPWRIAFLGVSAPQTKPITLPDGTTLVAADVIQSVGKYVKLLRSQVHLIIVLAHIPFDQASALAKAYDDIDMILGGDGTLVHFEPQFVNNAYIMYGGQEGKYVGVMEAFPSGNVLDKLGCRIVALDTAFADDPEMAESLNNYRTEAQKKFGKKVLQFEVGDESSAAPVPDSPQSQKK